MYLRRWDTRRFFSCGDVLMRAMNVQDRQQLRSRDVGDKRGAISIGLQENFP